MAKGIKTGGRQKGTPNKTTLEHLSRANESVRVGITPLEVILRTMRALWAEAEAVDSEGKPTFDMGKAKDATAVASVAAPYVHPRLNSIEGNPDKPLVVVDESSMLERARRVAFTLIQGARGAPPKALAAPTPKPKPPKKRQRATA